LISHSLEDVAMLCERVIILSKGKINFDGSKHQAFENVELLEKSGLLPPDILYLQHRLKLKGFKIDKFEYSIEKVADMIVKNLHLPFAEEGDGF